MPGPLDPNNQISIDQYGQWTMDGEVMEFKDYLDYLDDAIEERVEILEQLRDPASDLQNLWGRKNEAFKDTTYNRASPIMRPTGYPFDIEPDDWRP